MRAKFQHTAFEREDEGLSPMRGPNENLRPALRAPAAGSSPPGAGSAGGEIGSVAESRIAGSRLRGDAQFYFALARQIHDLQNLLWPAAVQADVAATDAARVPPARETLEKIGRGVRDAMEVALQMSELVKRRSQESESDAGEPAATPAPLPPPTARSRMRILCADSDANVLQMIACLVTHLGHDADLACSGTQALELFTAHAYDLVLTDLNLAELDGREVTRRIRASGVTPVFWMANTAPASPGADDAPTVILTKPVTLSALRKALAGMA